MQKSLVNRSLSSIAWQSVANWGNIVVSFFQSIYLTRNLDIPLFGQFAFASSIVAVIATINKFGTGAAFVYRSEHTENEKTASETLLTFKLMVVTTSLLIVTPAVYWFVQDGVVRLAMYVLIGSSVFQQLFLHIPRLILMRRVVHRRVAVIDLISNYLSAFVAIGWTIYDPSIWVFLAANLTKRLVQFCGFYLWRPFWIPRLRWDKNGLRYYLQFGGKNLVANTLLTTQDRVDDFWVGAFIGSTALGIYSRAYKFATYPRQVVAYSVNIVILGTYAEAKDNREQLSKTFFRANSFLIRTGFLMAGILSLVIPEFVTLILTDKWASMIPVFRLMLIFTLLDPLKLSIGKIFLAVGHQEVVIRARIIQLCTLLLGMALFYSLTDLGVIGVAISVNLMLIVGMAILFNRVRQFVDFSIVTMFLSPTIALFIGYCWTAIILSQIGNLADWQSALIKIATYSFGYLLTLLLLEYRKMRPIAIAYWAMMRKRLGNR